MTHLLPLHQILCSLFMQSLRIEFAAIVWFKSLPQAIMNCSSVAAPAYRIWSLVGHVLVRAFSSSMASVLS